MHVRGDVARAGGSPRCCCSHIDTNFAGPTPAKPPSRRCGGQIARCKVPVATATTSLRGASTTTDRGVNAPGATAASAPATLSPTPCSISVSGRCRPGGWPPCCSVWRARLAASPENWVSMSAPALGGAGGGAMPRCPMRWIATWRGRSKPTHSIPRPARRAKPTQAGRRRWDTGRVGAARNARPVGAMMTKTGQP
jgi:hypothetical protein